MSARRLLAALMWAALAAALGLAAPAAAQEVPGNGEGGESATVSPPAERYAVSPGGVDMRSGVYAYRQTDLSIGEDSEAGGLALTRSNPQALIGHSDPFANFSHNWVIMLSEKRVNLAERDYDDGAGNDYRISVHFGGRSETFDGAFGQTFFEQVSRTALARLTYSGDRAGSSVVYTYRAADGTIAEFRPLGTLAGSECTTHRRCAFVSHVVLPDGTRFDFQYDTGPARLRRVTSSRGFALILGYGSGADSGHIVSACTVNLAAVADPGTSCPASPQGSASYSYTTFGNKRRLASATDAGGGTWGFTYSGTQGAFDMGFVRPGDSGAWQVNSVTERQNNEGHVDLIVGGQAFADGSSFGYGWDESPFVEGEIPQIAGGSYQDAAGAVTRLYYGFHRQPPGTQTGIEQPPVNVGDDVYQITPGPERIVDPLGREFLTDYCDPNALNLPPPDSYCLVSPLARSFTEPDGRKTDLQWDFATRNLLQTTRHPRPGTGLPDIVTSSTYDCSSAVICAKPQTVTDARGNTTEYDYDPTHGGVTRETLPARPNGVRPDTRHRYEQRTARRSDGSAAGPPVWLLAESVTCRTSAGTGNFASPCAAAGDEVRTLYDYGPTTGPNNLLLRGQVVQADGQTWRSCFAYDVRGRRISETGPGAALASCPAGAPTSAGAFTASTRYDAMGRVTGTISADPDGSGTDYTHRATRNVYDAAGRLLRVEMGTLAAWQSEAVAPASWAGFPIHLSREYGYDSMNRKVRETVSSNGVVQTLTENSYDVVGRPLCTAIRMDPSRFAITTNACTQSSQIAGTPDRIVRSVYDLAGQRLQLREAVGTPIEAAEATWRYNVNGQIDTIIDGNGNRAELRYDDHARQSCWLFPSPVRPQNFDDSTPATALASAGSINGDCVDQGDFESYGYDLNSNRTSLRTRAGETLTYTYDALNRMSSKTVPNEPSVAYAYDNPGRMTGATQTPPSGYGQSTLYQSWTYDALGRVLTETSQLGTMTSQYDLQGRRTRLTWRDGFTIGYTWLETGEMFRIFENPDGNNLLLAIYWYDALGNRTVLSRANGTITFYNYDPAFRLNRLEEGLPGTANDLVQTYAYNPASQIVTNTRSNPAYSFVQSNVSRTDTHNGLNQIVTTGGTTVTHDARGNVTFDGTRTFTYSPENRLRTATAGGTTRTLFYDAMGRLSQTNFAPTVWLGYDGDRLVVEDAGTGSIIRRYVHGPGIDEPLVWYEGSGTTDRRFLHPDERGSIIAVTNQSGALVGAAPNTYDEYGIPAATNIGRFGYTGQQWLPQIGLWHYKARMYHPVLGRFMQVDPVGYEDQVNLYAYAGDDPLNITDPTGMCSTVSDEERRADCIEKRQAAIIDATEYIAGQSVRSGNEPAYIATFNEDTGEVTVRTGDDAGIRTNNDVVFTDREGNPLVGEEGGDGRILERVDGSYQRTNEIVLVTGHGHTSDAGGGPSNPVDRANEGIGRNPADRTLSRIAPAVIKGPSGRIRVFVNGRQAR